jgi:adenylate cyclase
METETGALSAAELAELAGVTQAEVNRLVGLGILVARDGAGPFLPADAQKVRLAIACEQAGLPMDGIASAIRAGRLSFTFVEAAPYRRWAVRSARTYRQVSEETGIPLDTLGSALESMGFARMAPDELIREDELEIVPLLQLGFSSGLFDLAWTTRLGRAHAEGLRQVAAAWADIYHARFEGAELASGGDQRTAIEAAARRSVDFLPLADPALLAIYRRQQELVWTEDLVERIESELEAARMLGRPGRVPAMSFLDLVGYTRLTEEQGDQVAAELAGTLAVLVDRFSREHGGVPVKWLDVHAVRRRASIPQAVVWSWRWFAACSSMPRSTRSTGTTATRQGVTARRVAVRRPPSSRAISPRTAPGPTSVTGRPSRSTSSTPSNSTNSRPPGPPCSTRSSPGRSRTNRGWAPIMTADSCRSRADSTAVTSTGNCSPPHGVCWPNDRRYQAGKSIRPLLATSRPVGS